MVVAAKPHHRPGQIWFRELEGLAIVPRRRNLFTPLWLGGSELLEPTQWDAGMFCVEASWELLRLRGEQTFTSEYAAIVVNREDDDAFYPSVVQHFTKEGKASMMHDDGEQGV
ncbi:hypothetical protein CYMTET_48047 [Cymbomonas tetramitiformis]|uniref:Uncharacterized protein n=1 Tax=Cymbomonas tetramitiformis TaxID=36881 RepID=A0AAE0BUM5_9CHLO|nr:hypothetical protein CYMTET_48047 [Cymbomonas tetramitiformis]